jgi:hypothetical protein
MREWPAIGVAVLVAPLVSGIVLGIVGTVASPGDWPLGLMMPLVGYQFSLAATATVGLPIFLILRQLRWLRWWVALLIGFPIGFLVGHFLFSGQPLWNPGLLGAIGSLSSWVFWLLWRKLTTVRALAPDPS